MRLWKKRDAENRHLEILSQKGKEGEKRPHLYPRRNGWGGIQSILEDRTWLARPLCMGAKQGSGEKPELWGHYYPLAPKAPRIS